LKACDVQNPGRIAKEHRHLVAEGACKTRFDQVDQRGLAGLFGRKNHVAAGAEAGDLRQAQRLELLAQLLILDPAATEVHPAQKGDVALHLPHDTSPDRGTFDNGPARSATLRA
jgi:hypothetical protein